MSVLAQRLAALSPGKRALMVRRNPLSFAQQRLWFLDQLEPGNAFYNMPAAARLSGSLRVEALRRSLEEIVRRHGILRTCFPTIDGQPIQAVVAPAPLALPVVDLGRLSGTSWEAEVVAWQERWSHEPFDLSAGPTLRGVLLRLSSLDHVFLLTLHHIVIDGWSLEVLFRELGQLYEALSCGRPSPLPELRLQYLDYARWQRQELRGEVLAGQLSYWRSQLEGIPNSLELPTDRPRPAVTTFRGAWLHRSLLEQLDRGLQTLSRRFGVTLFITLLSGFQALMSRLTGAEDVVVGSPIISRGRLETEELIGLFLNNLVLRTGLQGNPEFGDILVRVREVALGAYSHQDLPFERLVEELQPERQLSRQPLFQVMFTLRPSHSSDTRMDGLRVHRMRLRKRGAKFDLTVTIREEEPLCASLEYNTDAFDKTTIMRLVGHYETLLAAVVADPTTRLADLPLLPPAQRHQLLAEWSDTRSTSPPVVALSELFAAQAERFGDRIALVHGDRQLSYRELDRRSVALACHLRRVGVRPSVRVGICMERSAEMLVALLAVLRAGGAYVPLDPSHPRQRLEWILRDAGAGLLLADERLPEPAKLPSIGRCEFPARGGDLESCPAVDGSMLAYVIYTSGSTGTPKGVEVPHRGVVSFLAAMRYRLGIGKHDVLLAVTTLSFDIAVLELFLPLTVGARVLLASAALARDGEGLGRLLETSGATMMQATPATWQLLLVARWRPRGRLVILSGGEALPMPLARQLAAAGDLVYNLYGPTETTIWSSVEKLTAPPDGETLAIGRPIANTGLYVLDRRGRPVPSGVVGELVIAGVGISRGYSNRPALTAERFAAHAASHPPGERCYRTGDLVRQLADGRLEFHGRVDHQVKVRGFRIELGEIEAALNRHPEIRRAVVTAPESTSGDHRLVAHAVAVEGTLPAASELRRFLMQSLPDYMVPALFVPVDALPLTPAGKVDRKALGRRIPSVLPEGRAEVPETPVEQLLAWIWEDLLGLKEIGLDDDFFALGGHSLLATQVLSRLREHLGVDLRLRELFEASTLKALAARVNDAMRAAAALPDLPITPIFRGPALPLSFAQERMWFLHQLEPDSAVYRVFSVSRLLGELEVPALERALAEIVRRHETLRTTFESIDGAPVARVAAVAEIALPLIDLTAMAAPREVARRWIAADLQRPFDLSRGPLFRPWLLRIGEREHICAFVLHHILCDGWSFGVLYRELGLHYGAFAEGRCSPLPELPIQYVDFANWQRSRLTGEVLERHLDYWRRQLEEMPPILELSTDRPRPAVQTPCGRRLTLHLPERLGAAVAQMGRRRGATLFMTLLSAFWVLLWRNTGQRDFCVGTPIANRTRLETEGLIGLFANTLVLRTAVASELPFAALLERIRNTVLDADAHQDLPFEKLVDELQPARSLSSTPLFQVMFLIRNETRQLPRPRGIEVEPIEIDHPTAMFDLTLAIRQRRQSLTCTFEHSVDLFDSATIQRLAAHYRSLLEAIVEAPQARLAELSILGQGERQELLWEWNDTAAVRPAGSAQLKCCAHELFERQAAKAPDAVALVFEDRKLSYGELVRRANRLAHILRDLGVGPEERVGLYLERSIELAVAVLGVLAAGGAYVPLDPAYPWERVVFLLEDARIALLLTGTELSAGWSEIDVRRVCLDAGAGGWGRMEGVAPSTPLKRVGAVTENLAYVLYTSGSTGRPKGVAMRHGALGNLISWQGRALPEPARTLQFASPSFDVSFQEMLSTWTKGGTLVLVRKEARRDPLVLLNALRKQVIERLFLPFVALQQLAEAAVARQEFPRQLRRIITAGEQLQITPAIARLFERLPGCALENQYGPTETHVVSTFVCRGRPVGWDPLPPIGRPIAEVKIRLLGARLKAVSIGSSGELYLGGASLARGYLDRPALTAERFVPDPLGTEPGVRLYRTGDLGRYRGGGDIEFLGRSDHQMKIRGFRIEPGEVEAVLLAHPEVAAAAVVAWQAAVGGLQLVAYAVPAGSATPVAAEVRVFLRDRLPEYMIPSRFCFLDALPLTSSGKLDRLRLPEPEAALNSASEAPSSPVEEVLASIWARVLDVQRPGARDNFFDLGGHSLLATQVVSRVRESFGIDLAVRQLFESPTIAELARIVEATLRRTANGAGPGPIERLPAGAPRPLSFAQQRFWLLQQIEPQSPAYNLPLGVELRGALKPRVLARALAEIVDRHEALRTVFPATDGEPSAATLQVSSKPLPLVDLCALPAGLQEQVGWRVLASELQRPFDLARGPLLRCLLIRMARQRHWMLLTQHHIVSDGWSVRLMTRELVALYRAFLSSGPSPLAAPPLQYADFAAWQRRLLVDDASASQLEYWRRQLRDVAPVELPLDHSRSAGSSHAGALYRFTLSLAVRDSLTRLCSEQGATLFMGLLAAFKAVLHSYSGQGDIVVGTPIAYRNAKELEGLIGPFANTLVLRSDLTGNPTFRQLVDRIRGVALQAYGHQDIPIELLVEELQPERSVGINPLFQVWIVLQNLPPADTELVELELSPLRVGNAAVRHDLRLGLVESPQCLRVSLEYRCDLFEPATIARMARRYSGLLELAVETPDRALEDLVQRLRQREVRRLRERKRTRRNVNLESLSRAKARSKVVLAGSSTLAGRGSV